MPKFTVSAKNYPLTLLLGALLFALTLFLTTQSVGKVGIPGGEDEGSGLGGTGRSGEFGGSGLGGTGGPSPFLGINEDLERAKQELEQAKEELKPVVNPEALDRMIRLETIREQATSIAEAPIIQTREPRNPDQADLNRLQNPDQVPGTQLARPTIEVTLPDPVIDPAELVEELSEQPGAPVRPTQEIAEAPEAAAQDRAVPATPAQQVTELAEASSEQMFDETDEFDESDSADLKSSERLQVPDRIQRPELPPFQRVRPAVGRSSVIPVRPQPPMRI